MLVLLWLGWYSPPAFSQSQAMSTPVAQGYRIPIEYDASVTPTPIIYLRINGTSLPFMLDTGCSFLILMDRSAARQLQLSPNGRKARITNANKSADIANIKRVELIGSQAATNQQAVIPMAARDVVIADLNIPADFPYKRRVAGTVGVSFFAPWNMQFDFVNKSLLLFPPWERPAQSDTVTTLPLHPTNNLYTVAVRSATGGSIDLLLDTGSLWLSMSETVVRQFQPVPTPDVLTESWGLSGSETCKMLLIPSLQLGSLTEANLPVCVTKSDSERSLLGMNVLARFRVTLDLEHQEMRLERGTDYTRQARLPGLPDVLAMKQNGEYVAYDVLPNSAAALAGIRVGDSIIQVDKQPLAALPLVSAQNLLNGYTSTKADVLVKRSGKSQHISYMRQSIFTMANGRGIGVGIGVAVSEKGELFIDALDPRSPAEEAGLHNGDQIIMVNDLPVRSTPFQRLAAEMKQPEGAEITLQIRRKSETKPREFRLHVRRLL